MSWQNTLQTKNEDKFEYLSQDDVKLLINEFGASIDNYSNGDDLEHQDLATEPLKKPVLNFNKDHNGFIVYVSIYSSGQIGYDWEYDCGGFFDSNLYNITSQDEFNETLENIIIKLMNED